ncbi:hypothetical protein [Corynebacterium endometrii]|uniref:Uncharacterized protein n=1 Tax=Corynebacterium endometrii TaxID=2488819 RepID=A0A4P7QGI8_9CORY|nr:hypothetical protein [Corynebacterium endometrii]QCB28076.1 hypothetical protein CENDO_03915 [Corynebacterium endometrii]
MGLFEALFQRGPRLASAPDSARAVDVPELDISTAESMLIITVPARVVPDIKAAAAGEAVVLRGDQAPRSRADGSPVLAAWLAPSKRDDLPVIDQDRGWLVPLPPEACRAVLGGLRAETGGYEVSERLAIVVE